MYKGKGGGDCNWFVWCVLCDRQLRDTHLRRVESLVPVHRRFEGVLRVRHDVVPRHVEVPTRVGTTETVGRETEEDPVSTRLDVPLPE